MREMHFCTAWCASLDITQRSVAAFHSGSKKIITRALGKRSRRETKAKVIDMWRVALKDALAFH
jgi:hypothetical protein